MPKSASRDVKKRLFEFAKNEYQSKSPNYVEVRKAKGVKTFYRGPIPQVILTKYKAIMYTVFADYGSIARLYYFNREGYCIQDSSYSETNLEKIKTHLKKTSSLVLRYPKLEVKPTIGNIAAEYDRKFVKILDDIEKITKRKIIKRSIITFGLKSENQTISFENLFTENSGFLEMPKGMVDDDLIEIALIFEAFKTALTNIAKTELITNLAKINTILYMKNIPNRMMVKEIIDFKIEETSLNREEIEKQNEIRLLFNFYSLFSDLLNDYLPIFKSEIILKKITESILKNLFSSIDTECLTATILFELSKEKIKISNEEIQSVFLLAVIFLKTISNSCLNIQKELSKFLSRAPINSEKYSVMKQIETEIGNYNLQKLVNQWRKNSDLFPSKFNAYFDKTVDELFKKSLQIDVEFTTDELEKPGDIILILTNLSDTNFGTFVLNNIKWTPKEALDIIGENRRFKLKMLEQRKEEKFSIPVIPRKIGTINFTSLDIQFNDFSGIKHYLRMDIPSLKIKK